MSSVLLVCADPSHPPLQVSHPVCSQEPWCYNQVRCHQNFNPEGVGSGSGSDERSMILSLIEICGEKDGSMFTV